MRYEKGHKELTRQKIVETAANRFRRDGIQNVGVADLMADAGLTHGGFYSHFKSKEDLVRAAVEDAAARSRCRFEKRMNESGLEGWIRAYLRKELRDHPEEGCTIVALATELARHSGAAREVFTDSVERLLKMVADHMPKKISPAERRRRSIGLFATLVGAMQLARATRDSKLSDEILDAGIAAAFAQAEIKSTSTQSQ